MNQGPVGGAAHAGHAACVPPQFDLFLRRIGDVDSPELTPWCLEPTQRGHTVLAVITDRGNARIAAARVVLGEGRSAMAAAASGDPRGNLKRELERQRAPSRSAIRSAIGDLALSVGEATLHVTSAFALRTANAQLKGMQTGCVARLEPEPGKHEKSEMNSRALSKLKGARSNGARAVYDLVDEFHRWLEHRYYHDEYRPDDISQTALEGFLKMAVTSSNRELNEPAQPDYARALPVPRRLVAFQARP